MSQCRLCLRKSDLINIFDTNLRKSQELRDFIVQATGVEIKETDRVSKSVCQRCCIIVIKIYKFRSKAIQNDKILKEHCGQHYSPPPSPPVSSFGTIGTQNTSNNVGNERRGSPPLLTPKKKTSPKHPSVNNVIRKNPNVKIPLKVFHSHVDPVISLNKDEVTEWLDNYRLQKDTAILNELQKLSHLTVRKITCNVNNHELYPKSGAQNSLYTEKQYEKSRTEQTPCTENGTANVTENVARNVPISPNICTTHKDKQENSKNNVAKKRTSVVEKTKRFAQNLLSGGKQHEKSRVEQTPCTENYATSVAENDATNVPISSNVCTPDRDKQENSKNSVAKKRTSVVGKTRRPGKRLEKRKWTFSDSDLSEEERMPVPKKRSLIRPSNDPQKMDISNYSTTNKKTQKEIFTKSLELAPSKIKRKEKDSKSSEQERGKDGILRALRELDLFMCHICSKVCSSKRSLSDHQRSHLKCKLCKKKMKHIEAVADHVNECYIINITNKLPNVSLVRADEDPIILKKYSHVFTNVESNEHIYKCETADSDVESSDFDCNVNESADSPHIEEIDVPMASSTNFLDETEDSVLKEGNETSTNDSPEGIIDKSKNDKPLESNKTILEQYITEKINETFKQTETSLDKSGNVQYKSTASSVKPSAEDKNTVCISDESDTETENANKSQTDDTECSNVSDSQLFESVSVMRPEIKIAENIASDVYSPQGFNKQNLTHVEEALIQALFVQYCVFKGKCCATQTFEPNDSSIKTLGNKLMSLEDMYSELSVHKIPVELEFDEKIRIKFKRITQKRNNDSSFSWEKLWVNHLKDKSVNKIASNLSNNEIIQIDDDDASDVVCSTVTNITSASTTANNVTEKSTTTSTVTVSNTASIVPPTILNRTNFVPSSANFVVVSAPITTAGSTIVQGKCNVSNLTRPENCSQAVVSRQESRTSVPSNSATIWLQKSEKNSQIIQPVGPQITQPVVSSPSGLLVLNPLTSPNIVTTNQKVMPSALGQQNQPRVVYSQVPSVFNANINNYNKVVVLASNSSLQPTNSSVQSSTPGSSVVVTEADRSSPSDQQSGESQVHQPLRVKSLWELTQPNK